jgi:hypothetical protein
MNRLSILRLAVSSAAAFILLAGTPGNAAPRKTLQAFASEQEITDLFKRWAEENQRRARSERRSLDQAVSSSPAPAMGALMSAPAAKAESAGAKERTRSRTSSTRAWTKRHREASRGLLVITARRSSPSRWGQRSGAGVSVADAFGAASIRAARGATRC